MKKISLIFPHQLFLNSPVLDITSEIYLIEEFLFFNQYKFHKQKLAFHRASMKAYQKYLEDLNFKVNYIEANKKIADIRCFNSEVIAKNIKEIAVVKPSDNWLEKRLQSLEEYCKIHYFDNQLFVNNTQSLHHFFKPEKKSFFQTTFYKQQRKRLNILLDENNKPVGGKWTYDTENRKKYPLKKLPPPVYFPKKSIQWDEAVAYVEKEFPNNLGDVSKQRIYPINHKEADEWLEQFLMYRFYDFGIYEDAIVKENSILNHSLLSPLLNIGLIEPKKIIDTALSFADAQKIPINSTEGFIRQIIGWREFIHGMYLTKGNYSRTKNFWNFDKKIPSSFYEGTTGIVPIDNTIKKILATGYCNHIERLMILGNFMLLCEFDPDEVYKWFMELFIDAYDWVMVPNVYGMCLFADGGTFATKPYIGGSNYIKKMSNYKSGIWDAVWDGMFWSFVKKQEAFFKTNPRTSMLYYNLQKMPKEKIALHIKNANEFIKNDFKIK